VKGALPAFEDFGGLPTHIVKENGLINGKKAHKVLDGLIIPGGSLIESESISNDLKQEIKKMNSQGSFILGVCSGFQILANKTDIGRRSPCPLEKEGLGLLDVSFHPMISNDRIEALIVDENSFLTKNLADHRITGFHCHTYGKIKGDAPPVFFSHIKRTDYKDNPRKILSGVRNDDGNVVGTMIHASLDENKALVDNILDFLDVGDEDILKIQSSNQELLKRIKNEVGIDTNIFVDNAKKKGSSRPKTSKNLQKSSSNHLKVIMIASTGSDSGKTFLTTGMVGALRKKGYRVCVLKVGPDIRDIVPSLYLNKEKMESFSSIKIGGLGWKDLKDVFVDLKVQDYDIILIEGVMSVFTGMLNKKTPFSSAEIAKAANIPVILVSPCNKGGIETAAVDIVGHVEVMDKMGIKTKGVILNRVYDTGISKAASSYINRKTGVQIIGEVPKIKMVERGNIPEVELKLDEFCFNAIETVEKYLNVEEIVKITDKPEFRGYLSYENIHDHLLNI